MRVGKAASGAGQSVCTLELLRSHPMCPLPALPLILLMPTASCGPLLLAALSSHPAQLLSLPESISRPCRQGTRGGNLNWSSVARHFGFAATGAVKTKYAELKGEPLPDKPVKKTKKEEGAGGRRGTWAGAPVPAGDSCSRGSRQGRPCVQAGRQAGRRCSCLLMCD